MALAGTPLLFLDQRVRSACLDAESAAELKALFDSLDKNGDGKVNSKEWGEGAAANKPLLDKHFGGANPATISQAIPDGDADSHGPNSVPVE